MLNEFENWFKTNAPRFSSRNYQVTIRRPSPDTDKNCAYADIESENCLARATVWESGEFQKEAVDPATGENLLYEYKVFRKPDELYASLETFVERLIGAASARA